GGGFAGGDGVVLRVFLSILCAVIASRRRSNPGPSARRPGVGALLGWTAPERHRCARLRSLRAQQRRPSVEKISRIGMDTSKQIFQLHGVDEAERVVLRRKLRRKEMMAFFAALAPTTIGIEACGGSHHWAREL